MENHIVLTSLQMLDVLFRFATAGTLSLLFVFLMMNANPAQKKASLSLITCLASYVLLTAPIENQHYGWLRPPLLLFTNCTCYALLAVYWHRVHGQSIVSRLPMWGRALSIIWFLWLAWFFVVEAGRGLFHTLHDGFGLFILVMIVIDAVRDLDDDLVESRRDIRKLAITFITFYSLFLTIIEVFFRHIKDDGLFSIGNALAMLMLTLWFSYRALKHAAINTANAPLSGVEKPLLQTYQPDIPPQVKTGPDKQVPSSTATPDTAISKLENLMAQGIYEQNGLTIARLAEAMNLPEHQLRVVINQQLGFDNFSQFLNSYRIPAICKKLQQTEYQNTPVLTLALETGYNSIAPFNRAFKEHQGMTPTQYRRDFAGHFQK